MISVEFGAVIEPSISPTSDGDEHFNITNKYTFEINTRVFRYVAVELFMSDVDGYAETVVSLACASKTIQC